jgi:hypothetical protein
MFFWLPEDRNGIIVRNFSEEAFTRFHTEEGRWDKPLYEHVSQILVYVGY